MQYTPRGSRTGQAAWKRTRTRLIKTREHACHWCQVPLRADAKKGTPQAIELDHLIAVAAGGTDSDDNLVLSCPRCNRSKGDRAAPSKRLDPLSNQAIAAVSCPVHGQFHEGNLLSTCPHSGSLVRPDDARAPQAQRAAADLRAESGRVAAWSPFE